MKKSLGFIPILAVLALLVGVALNATQKADVALAASPTIEITKLNPLNDLGVTSGATEVVETSWANFGTNLIVTITDTDAAGAPTDQAVSVTVESDEADDSFTFSLEEGTGAPVGPGVWQFNIELTVSSTTAPTLDADADLLIDSGATSQLTVEDEDEVKVTVQAIASSIDFALTRRVDVENKKPDITGLTPEHEDVVDDEDVDVTFTIEDDDSGIPSPEDIPDGDGDDEYTSAVILVFDTQCTDAELIDLTDISSIAGPNMAVGGGDDLDCASDGAGDNLTTVITINDEDDFDDTSDGFDVDTAVFLSENDTHFITVLGFDSAGNFDFFDADSDDDKALAQITVDTEDPSIDVIRTGVAWDSADDEYDDDRAWIQVLFADKTDLDQDSIDVDDFVVEGHTIRRVQWFDVDPNEVDEDVDGTAFSAGCSEDVSGDDGEDCRPTEWDDSNSSSNNDKFAMIRNSVFIQLENDLDPDETPDVNVVPDGVDDEAGNNQDSDDDEAEDWISPNFTVEEITTPLSPLLLAGEDMETELIVSADEELNGDPTVTVSFVNAPPGCVDDGVITPGAAVTGEGVAHTCPGTAFSSGPSDTVREIGTNRWRITIDEPTDTGFFNIFIEGDDEEGNTGDEGIAPGDIIDDFFKTNGDVDEDDAVFFEGDIFLPIPEVTIGNADLDESPDDIEFRNPLFIEIDFDATNLDEPDGFNEDKEYEEDGFDDLIVTLFELDGVDLTSEVSTTNDRTFLVAIDNISIGEHEIVVQARDQAGNELEDDLELDFEVEERDAFELDVNPGWNLISVSGEPADPSIDTVLGPDTPVTTVYTFDPTVPGGWLVAVRETPDDPWVGDLTEINANRGYWFLADQIAQIDIDVPRITGGAVNGGTPIQPPIIDLFPGWNLVPIVDTTGDAGFEDTVDADTYFACCDDEINRIQRFNTITNAWETVPFGDDPQNSDGVGGLFDDPDLLFGSAYWVFVTDPVTLVP